jgi:hypothetical protein
MCHPVRQNAFLNDPLSAGLGYRENGNRISLQGIATHLSPLRLPFRHIGALIAGSFAIRQSKTGNDRILSDWTIIREPDCVVSSIKQISYPLAHRRAKALGWLCFGGGGGVGTPAVFLSCDAA